MLKRGKPTISSKCSNAACVEVTLLDNGVQVRDTKEGGGEPLVFPLGDWAAFLRVYARAR